ncbi:hypothetical protein BH20ACI3_BH20ACI3_34520 [soil metagenome]
MSSRTGTYVMSATSATMKPYSFGWLRGATFDLGYIFGIAAIALCTGAIVVMQPGLFPLIIFLDLWLLGYHHVISTFTRLTFDRDSFREHRFLVIGLPPIVLLGVTLLWLVIGAWVLPTLYLYWQWFHYTRQSYGIARIYKRKGSPAAIADDLLTQAMLYLIPFWGILYRSYQAPEKFLWMPVKTLPVPFLLAAVVGIASVVTIAWWSFRQLRAFARGQLLFAHTLYVSSHTIIFVTGYILIPDINHGWLVVNIWHNLQYVLLVWMFNNNRFKTGIDARHRLLSSISQRQKVSLYFAVCLGISTATYLALSLLLTKASSVFAFAAAAPLILIAYQAINFHHYIVDALIWKARKKSVKQNFGIAT